MFEPKSHDPADPPAEILARARRVRLAAFDVDGVLTDGRLATLASGEELKAFHVHDGLGLKLLAAAGVTIAWITARASDAVTRRAAELGVVELHQGVGDKPARLESIAAARGIALDEVAYMGDDLPDLACLARVGLALAPSNAHPWVHERAHWRTRAAGGGGAVREACDLILVARGEREAILARALAGRPT
jgi:3-deoxy-D-manno-octulosonate 8-phosphate phosphatase (KDO 8-P phosphatase)